MSKENIIRAWKDPKYRKSLSASELSNVPANPAGVMVLGAEDLEQVSGGFTSFIGKKCKPDPGPQSVTSIACCVSWEADCPYTTQS